MKYKLIKPINENYCTIEQILTNRGIKHEDIKHYLNTTDNDINSPLLFGEERLKRAVAALIKTINNNLKCVVIVDSDCDGFTSSAVLINYLYDLFPSWVENNLTWFIHEGKQHGLSDFELTEDIALLIIPDASSNDYEYHKQLKEKGIDIIILDHHEAEKESEDAIVINNQLSDYPNKNLSGVGVTWQFCRYLDSLLNTSYANKYIDLVALGNMADMMSMVSIETKHLITKGFKEENIKNPFIAYMADKNSYSLGGKVTPMGAAFYIAPYVNAIVRSGTIEEKQVVFKSMLGFEAFKKVPSTKRGHKLGEEEQLVIQAIRTATNVKNRQTRAQDAGLELLEHIIDEKRLLDNKVLLFLLEPGQIDKNIAGLIANKFMAKYQRPCCILTKVEMITYDPTIENIYRNDFSEIESIDYGNWVKEISYQGSARGYDKSGINNFKDICEKCPSTIFAEGHQSAFGLGIECGIIEDGSEEVFGEGIYQFIDYTNDILKDVSSEPIYLVDYIYDGYNVDPQNIIDIAKLEELWGKDVDEPFVAIKDLKVTKDMVQLMSPDKKPTLKITLPNKVSLIKFNSSQEEYEKFISDGYVCIDVIGKCNKNEWNGFVNAQIFIEDYEIVDSSKYFF